MDGIDEKFSRPFIPFWKLFPGIFLRHVKAPISIRFRLRHEDVPVPFIEAFCQPRRPATNFLTLIYQVLIIALDYGCSYD
jgi:hypothetical protein